MILRFLPEMVWWDVSCLLPPLCFPSFEVLCVSCLSYFCSSPVLSFHTHFVEFSPYFYLLFFSSSGIINWSTTISLLLQEPEVHMCTNFKILPKESADNKSHVPLVLVFHCLGQHSGCLLLRNICSPDNCLFQALGEAVEGREKCTNQSYTQELSMQ